MNGRGALRRLLAALALANILFLSVWKRLLSEDFAYYAARPPVNIAVATCASVLVAGLGIFLALESFRGLGLRGLKSLLGALALAGAAVGAAGAFAIVRPTSTLGPFGIRWALVALLPSLVAVVLLRRRLPQIADFAAVGLVGFSVTLPFTFGSALVRTLTPRGQAIYAPARSAPFLPGTPVRRVVWVIFDEMDFDQSFGRRDPSLDLVAFDRFRKESLFAEAAFSPTDGTISSIPSLLSETWVEKAEPRGSRELLLHLGGGRLAEAVPWSRQPNVFRRAASAGVNSAVAGYLHPYCRLFGSDLSRCLSVDAPMFGNELRGDTVAATFLYEWNRLGHETLKALGIRKQAVEENVRRATAQNYLELAEEAKRDVADPRLGVVFIHVQAPHAPIFWDRKKAQFEFSSPASHLDGLALADRFLDELDRALADSGLADRTTMILSSDHSWRIASGRLLPEWTAEDARVAREPRDYRVIFLARFPSDRRETPMQERFNTVHTGALVLAVLKGEVSDGRSAASLLLRLEAESPDPRLFLPVDR